MKNWIECKRWPAGEVIPKPGPWYRNRLWLTGRSNGIDLLRVYADGRNLCSSLMRFHEWNFVKANRIF